MINKAGINEKNPLFYPKNFRGKQTMIVPAFLEKFYFVLMGTLIIQEILPVLDPRFLSVETLPATSLRSLSGHKKPRLFR